MKEELVSAILSAFLLQHLPLLSYPEGYCKCVYIYISDIPGYFDVFWWIFAGNFFSSTEVMFSYSDF